MHWLVDLGVAMVIATFFFDLFESDRLVAYGVGVVGLYYLMEMFNEVMFKFTGTHAW